MVGVPLRRGRPPDHIAFALDRYIPRLTMTQPRLPDGWTLMSGDEGVRWAQNLARELGPQHVLAGIAAVGVARRQDCDDVLFRLVGHRCTYALVHLTWRTWREGANPKFPWTELCEREEDLAALLQSEG